MAANARLSQQSPVTLHYHHAGRVAAFPYFGEVFSNPGMSLKGSPVFNLFLVA